VTSHLLRGQGVSIVIRLYQGSGSGEIVLGGYALPETDWLKLKEATIRLLNARGSVEASEILKRVPFEIREGSNFFADEFSLLYYPAPLDAYVELGEKATEKSFQASCAQIARTITEIGPYIRFIAVDLDTKAPLEPVPNPNLVITSDLVERALAETEKAVSSKGSLNGVDRAHTAFHGYLRAICQKESLSFADDAGITDLLKVIQKHHPAMQVDGARQDDITKIARAMASILDALGPLRNRASLAHANDALVDEAEAMLVINAVRTLLHYLNAKIK
jgi:hypothetical protein